jgi:hypothetical protein
MMAACPKPTRNYLLSEVFKASQAYIAISILPVGMCVVPLFLETFHHLGESIGVHSIGSKSFHVVSGVVQTDFNLENV